MTTQQEWRRARNERIVALLLAGQSRGQIAKEVSLSYGSINGILRRAGHGFVGNRKPRKTAPDTTDQNIISVYRNGYTARETGAACGVKFQRVLAVLHRWAPETIRPPHLNKSSQLRQQARP
jgi:transposase